MSRILLPIFSIVRMAVGGSCVVVPQLACQALHVPFASSSALGWRLFGSRDFILGAYLWLAKDANPRTALLLGLAVDSIDVSSATACFLEGNVGWEPLVSVGAGAAVFVCLGLAGLYGTGGIVLK
jgi:hypothetical protein